MQSQKSIFLENYQILNIDKCQYLESACNSTPVIKFSRRFYEILKKHLSKIFLSTKKNNVFFRNQTLAHSLDAELRVDSKYHHLSIYKNEWFSRKSEFSRRISKKRQKPFHLLALFRHFPLIETKTLYMV